MPYLLTIFTPTYNRAHTLPILFESLKKQTSKNFEWLIVDDGSLDTTKDLVEEFKKESDFSIRCIFQNNQGKHIAINNGVENAKGKYFVIVDSDDFLLENATKVMEELTQKIDSIENIGGFTYIHFQKNTPYKIEDFGKKQWFQDEKYDWKFPGEMQYVYKIEVLKKFPFPQFPGEKFCPESLIHHQIGNHYKVLYTDNVLASGEYQQDGLSSNFAQLMEKNPKTAMLFYSQKLKSKEFDKETKRVYTKNYWNIALKAKHISWFQKFLGISFSHSFWFWKNRILK